MDRTQDARPVNQVEDLQERQRGHLHSFRVLPHPRIARCSKDSISSSELGKKEELKNWILHPPLLIMTTRFLDSQNDGQCDQPLCFSLIHPSSELKARQKTTKRMTMKMRMKMEMKMEMKMKMKMRMKMEMEKQDCQMMRLGMKVDLCFWRRKTLFLTFALVWRIQEWREVHVEWR